MMTSGRLTGIRELAADLDACVTGSGSGRDGGSRAEARLAGPRGGQRAPQCGQEQRESGSQTSAPAGGAWGYDRPVHRSRGKVNPILATLSGDRKAVMSTTAYPTLFAMVWCLVACSAGQATTDASADDSGGNVACGELSDSTRGCCPSTWKPGAVGCSPVQSSCWSECTSVPDGGTYFRSMLLCGADGVILSGEGLFPCSIGP